MSAGARHRLVLSSGKDMVLSKDVADAFGGIVLGRDNQPRDITNDTLSIAAKLDTIDKTANVTVAKDSPQTLGKYTVTVAVGATDTAAELFVDVKNAKSGGAAQIIDRLQFTVEDSDAD